MSQVTHQNPTVQSAPIAFHWKTQEYSQNRKSLQWYAVAAIILSLMVGYALWTNSPLMAITFILIGFTGYIILEKDPPELHFSITEDGIQADREIYEYENIQSFSVLRLPKGNPILSLHTNADFIPYVRIPLGNQDIQKVRAYLSEYIEENKHPTRLIDILDNFF